MTNVTIKIICVYKRCACHNRKQSESSSFPVKQSGGWPGQTLHCHRMSCRLGDRDTANSTRTTSCSSDVMADGERCV